MGTTKNIEMREYNRSDYNLLLPKTDSYTKEETLASYTKNLLKLTESAVPDDAFLALFLGVDSYLYRVKVQLSDGTPVSGSTISGLSAITGQTLTTGDDGIVLGKSTSTSVTINCTSPYIDQEPPAAQKITKTGTITDVTITLVSITSLITKIYSFVATISKLAKSLDIAAVNGGQDGGPRRDGPVPRLGGAGRTLKYSKNITILNRTIRGIVGSHRGPEDTSENQSTFKFGENNHVFTTTRTARPQGNGSTGHHIFDENNFVIVGSSGGNGVNYSIGSDFQGDLPFSVSGQVGGTNAGAGGSITCNERFQTESSSGGNGGIGCGGGGGAFAWVSSVYNNGQTSSSNRRLGGNGAIFLRFHF